MPHDHRTRRLNPGIPIPPEATAIHRLTDADVAHEPAFRRIAAGLLEFLDGDLCGSNLKRFDLRMLHCEFRRPAVVRRNSFPLARRDSPGYAGGRYTT
jgi:DNA polymerase-3 subunit epsilon